MIIIIIIIIIGSSSSSSSSKRLVTIIINGIESEQFREDAWRALKGVAKSSVD